MATYDKQDLLIELRKLAASDDTERAHAEADTALLRYIDDEHITAAYGAIRRWHA